MVATIAPTENASVRQKLRHEPVEETGFTDEDTPLERIDSLPLAKLLAARVARKQTIQGLESARTSDASGDSGKAEAQAFKRAWASFGLGGCLYSSHGPCVS
jgi:hypothetical protein